MDARQAVQLALASTKPVEAARPVKAADPDEESLGEIKVAEYVIFLLAFDTYIRYVEEATQQDDPTDDVIQKGLRLLRVADTELEALQKFMDGHLPSDVHKRMLMKAVSMRASNSGGVGRRALMMRTLLSRGGATTMRAVFENSRMLKQVREAISASMLDDADAALDLFAKMLIRNARLRDWIDLAAETAGSGTLPANVVEAGATEAQDQKQSLLTQNIEQLAASGADASREAQEAQSAKLVFVQEEATAAARKALEQSGEPDEPLTRSEIVGVAVAAAAAATSDASNPQNVPEPLRGLDNEQRAAALTDGKVGVFAGAGSGKSTTLGARVAYLVKDRRVNPSRVLVTSFNVKAASELKEKIGRTSGADALQQMSVGTMHGLFRKFIMEFGTPAEKASMGAGFVEAGNSVAFAVQRIWEECYGKDRPVPKLKSATMHKARWSGNDISPAEAQAQATTMEEADAAMWYGIYEGLKGTSGNYRPPCPSKAYESFMAKHRSRADRLGDFTDMLKIYRDILKRNPAVRAKVQGMFDHIIVDEAQDRNTLMAEIIDMMSEHIGDGSDGKSVWIVGDDKQAINSFQGAKAKLFKDLYQKEGWKTRVIRTNYRCEPEIVDCANKLIAHNDGNVPIPQMPAPDRKPGNGSVQVHAASDEVDAALMAVQEIKQNHVLGGDFTDHAILCRTNKELHSYETACIIRGVPYARRGASSFLGSPETKAVLGYVQLVTGNDFTKGQVALGSVINNPNRFFLSDPKKAPEAVENAFSQYARILGTDVKSIDPMKAMKDRSFIRALADQLAKLTRTGKGFKFEEKIEDLGYGLEEIRARSNTEEYTTKDLFDEILSLEGVAIDNGVFKPQTFRESLKVSLRDAMTDDDAAAAEEEEEDDDTKGLGNVSFLYQLAKPDPTDEDDEITPPTTPHGFAAKMARYASKMRDLRTDTDKWVKDQSALPPEQRRPPPGVYIGTVHCSPADEPVLTTSGWVPIGDLDPETHRLASYTPHCNQLFWGRKKGNHEGPDGYGFQKARNFFKGTLLTLTTERSKTRVTPDHKIRVKWAESFHNKYVVYLMRRGDWWRVGHCQSCPRPYKAGDLGSRLATEKADGGWILKVCETKEDAILEEVRIQSLFGIPGTTFEATKARTVTSIQLHAVHESVKQAVAPRAKLLLKEFGLSPEYPLYHGGPDRDCDKRESFTIQARNCLSGYMLLPVVSEAFVQPSGTRETWTKPEWYLTTVSSEAFEGDVFSLVVWPHHFYVSGGAIVHNSVKGAQWKTTFVQMPKGKFPIEFRQKPGEPPPDPEKEKERIEDERRLAYVALTRAAKNLRVLCPKVVGGKPAGVSEFVDEAELNLGENVQKADGADMGLPKEASLYDWEEGHDA
jgi:superfamily I DNA/RNA helicase